MDPLNTYSAQETMETPDKRMGRFQGLQARAHTLRLNCDEKMDTKSIVGPQGACQDLKCASYKLLVGVVAMGLITISDHVFNGVIDNSRTMLNIDGGSSVFREYDICPT